MKLNGGIDEKEYLFKEDARKFALILWIAVLINILAFLLFIVYEIVTFVDGSSQKIAIDSPMFFESMCSLVASIGLFIALCVGYFRYFKCYMFITQTDMQFFASKKRNKYHITEFTGYEFIRMSGRHSIFRLTFSTGEVHDIITIKWHELQLVLDKLLEDKGKI